MNPDAKYIRANLDRFIWDSGISSGEERILRILAEHTSGVLPIHRLLDIYYAMHPDGGPDWAYNAIRVMVFRIRKKLAAEKIPITIARQGYRGYYLARVVRD